MPMTREDCFEGCPILTDDGWFGVMIGPKMDTNFWRVLIDGSAGPFSPDADDIKERTPREEYVYHISCLSIVG